jgi:hypothetical protein
MAVRSGQKKRIRHFTSLLPAGASGLTHSDFRCVIGSPSGFPNDTPLPFDTATIQINDLTLLSGPPKAGTGPAME